MSAALLSKASAKVPAQTPQKTLVPPGYGLTRFARLDSTNSEARRRAQRLGASARPHWLVAAEQSAGRGRHGRAWHSPRGNLFASLLLPRVCLRRAHELAFVAGLSARAALAQFVPPPHALQLKWPNDVLLNDRKICGILLESGAPDGAGASWLALGIGINLVAHPPKTAWPAIALAALVTPPPDADSMLAALTHAFAAQYAAWREQGFDAVRTAWLASAWGRGKRVRVRVGAQAIEGRFRTLTAEGALCLDTDAGPRTLLAGDMFFAGARA